jgi:hypothetical protein
MIVYLSTERFSRPIRYYVDYHRDTMRRVVTSLTYEELFFEGAGPVGHYIFTDFDRLSRYELECAAAFANTLHKAAPEARILNHPLRALERYPLLIALHKAGINDFTATRLECGDRPPCYPVFIRAEDGYGGPETDLLHNEVEFNAALEDLKRCGRPRRGRIAIGFANECSSDGYFHKYGAFNVGGRIVPHDLMYGQTWVVKIRFADTGWAKSRDASYGDSEEGIARELQYIRDNPHQEALKRVFAVGGIDYGRADYGIVNGRIQVYEINTNPHLPYQPSPDARVERRAILQRSLLEAIKAIDRPSPGRGRVSFDAPRPRTHNLHWPRQRLPISLARRAFNFLARR